MGTCLRFTTGLPDTTTPLASADISAFWIATLGSLDGPTYRYVNTPIGKG